ncbi:MAG: hypothetical protein ACREJD_12160 [Phycisphaerales bacterium]
MGQPTPDGSKWAWVDFGEDPDSSILELCLFDFSAASTRRFRLGQINEAWGLLTGFTPDGRAAVFISELPKTEGDLALADDAHVRMSMRTVDLATGEQHLIGNTTLLVNESFVGLLAACQNSGNPTWAVLTQDLSGPKTLIIGGPEGEHRVSAERIPRHIAHRISFSSKGAIILHLDSSDGTPQVIEFDGKLRSKPAPAAMVYSRDRVSFEIGGTELAVLDVDPGQNLLSWWLCPDNKWLITSDADRHNSVTIQGWNLTQKP